MLRIVLLIFTACNSYFAHESRKGNIALLWICPEIGDSVLELFLKLFCSQHTSTYTYTGRQR